MPLKDEPQHPAATRSRWAAAGALGLATVPLLLFVTIDLPLKAHLMLSGIFMAAGYWIATRRPDLRLALIYLSSAVSLRYMIWRATYTLALDRTADQVFASCLFAAELYGLMVLLAGYFQTVVLRPRRPIPLPDNTALWPWVDVLIPTYNESPDIVRRTLIGAQAMTYPNKRIYVLDDGRRPEMRALAESLGVGYRVRDNNDHAKAGNINAALKSTNSELIAIFDCDHVPVRSFLNVTVGLLVADPLMALVQTPHHFYNPDPFQRNLWLEDNIPPEQQVFYHSVQIGNDYWNSVLFCGSCAVLRRTALVGVGGIAQETVTEDAHTSLKLAAAGWNSAYLDVPLAAGLATESYADHIAQRIRWARGMTQILRLDNPLTKPGLTFAQRVSYLNSVMHFQFGVPRIIFILAPALYLIFGLHPLAATPGDMLAYGLPHMFLAVLGGLAGARWMRPAFWAEVYEVALAPYTALVTAAAFFSPRRGKFNVTAKDVQVGQAHFDWRRALPNLVLFGIAVTGLLVGPARILSAPLEGEALVVAVIFNVFNVAVVFTALTVALERKQSRSTHRIPRRFSATVELDDGRAMPASTVDITESGARIDFYGEELSGCAGWIWIEINGGWAPPIRFTVQNESPTPEGKLHGVRFVDVSETERRFLVEFMFSEPDSWSVAPEQISTAGSVRSIMRAPWRAARGIWGKGVGSGEQAT
jgi:cellulose synthase (UDP-forming)